jgi:hypothetical protein
VKVLERCKKCVAIRGGYLERNEITFYFKCICSYSINLETLMSEIETVDHNIQNYTVNRQQGKKYFKKCFLIF